MKFLFKSWLVSLLAYPAYVSAQLPTFSGGIVPCGRQTTCNDAVTVAIRECGFCDLILLAQNIINFLIFAGSVAAVLLFVYAGILYVTSPGNSGNISKAHSIFWNVLIGLIVTLAAWLMVDVVMKTLLDASKYGDNTPLGPWNGIICGQGTSAGVTPGSTCPCAGGQGTCKITQLSDEDLLVPSTPETPSNAGNVEERCSNSPVTCNQRWLADSNSSEGSVLSRNSCQESDQGEYCYFFKYNGENPDQAPPILVDEPVVLSEIAQMSLSELRERYQVENGDIQTARRDLIRECEAGTGGTCSLTEQQINREAVTRLILNNAGVRVDEPACYIGGSSDCVLVSDFSDQALATAIATRSDCDCNLALTDVSGNSFTAPGSVDTSSYVTQNFSANNPCGAGSTGYLDTSTGACWVRDENNPDADWRVTVPESLDTGNGDTDDGSSDAGAGTTDAVTDDSTTEPTPPDDTATEEDCGFFCGIGNFFGGEDETGTEPADTGADIGTDTGAGAATVVDIPEAVTEPVAEVDGADIGSDDIPIREYTPPEEVVTEETPEEECGVFCSIGNFFGGEDGAEPAEDTTPQPQPEVTSDTTTEESTDDVAQPEDVSCPWYNPFC